MNLPDWVTRLTEYVRGLEDGPCPHCEGAGVVKLDQEDDGEVARCYCEGEGTVPDPRKRVLEVVGVDCPCDAWNEEPNYDYCGFCLASCDHDDDCHCGGTEVVPNLTLARTIDGLPEPARSEMAMGLYRAVAAQMEWTMVGLPILDDVVRIYDDAHNLVAKSYGTSIDAMQDALGQALGLEG